MHQEINETILIVAADVAKNVALENNVKASELPDLIKLYYGELQGILNGEALNTEKIAASLGEDFLTCLECNRKLRSLKGHLKACHGLTVDAYRAKWRLPADYPMTAPSYSAKRAKLARKQGLGQDGKKNSKGHRQAARPPSNRTVNFKKKI